METRYPKYDKYVTTTPGHTKAAPVAWTRAGIRWQRVLLLTVTGLAVLWTVMGFWLILASNAPGGDMQLYRDATARWMGGGSFYWPYQLSGPYIVPSGGSFQVPILYPPVTLALLIPGSFLPPVLWYAIPLGVTAAIVASYRPSLLGWTLIAVCMGMVASIWSIVAGNPVMWMLMAVALSTRWRWVSAFVLFKPSLFPFALPGVRDPRWWAVVAGMVVLTVAWWPMTLDWFRVVLNASGERSGVLYSLREVPLLAIPWIAWATRSTADDDAEDANDRLGRGGRLHERRRGDPEVRLEVRGVGLD